LFNTSVRVIAEALGSQAALAFEIEGARRVREQHVLLDDRERIARDLHDHVIQRLFAAGLSLQSSLTWVTESKATQRISDSVDVLDGTIREIRNTIFSLSASDEFEPGLRAQVLDVVHQVQVALDFVPEVEFAGLVDAGVPGRLVPHVVACVREALSNVARHARASTAMVQLVVSDDSLVITVSDNGVGMGSSNRSSGLSNLGERARLLHGTFATSPVATGGTRVEWSVPLSS
jgi:signal transduction histidine kinase